MCAAVTKKAKTTQSATPQKQKNNFACSSVATTSTQAAKNANKKPGKCCTKITAKFNCGFENALCIRGEGIKGLNWNNGVLMKNVKDDEWCWETNEPFQKAQFKILINDKEYELGENHIVESGKSFVFVPQFNH